MSVNTFSFVMIRKIKWAPYSLVVKHVKIFIVYIIVDKLRSYLRLRMCKRTISPVFTIQYFIRIKRTKLGFVIISMIKQFHIIVTSKAAPITTIRLRTHRSLFHIFSPLILVIVKKWTLLMRMRIFFLALKNFEGRKSKER